LRSTPACSAARRSPAPGQPCPQHLTDLSHGNLPERHPQNPQADRLEGTRYRK
jgi:hypothetical protein